MVFVFILGFLSGATALMVGVVADELGTSGSRKEKGRLFTEHPAEGLFQSLIHACILHFHQILP